MKRVMAMLTCLVLLFAAAGCGKNHEKAAEQTAKELETPQETPRETPEETATETPEEIAPPIEIDTELPLEKGLRIAVVVKEKGSGYWKNLEEHMQEAVDYLNQEYQLTGDDEITMTFEGSSQEEDVTSQINIIDAVLAENPSVLCLAAVDEESCEAQLETAGENGIPVIMFDSNIDSKLVHTYCGTNNKKAGRLAADKLAEAIGEKGEAAVFAHENITQTSVDRVEGFQDRLKKKHPGVRLDVVSYENEEESTEERIRSVLDSHENLKGIFCTNGTIAETVLDILQDYPDRELKVVGFDSGSAQKKAVEEGREYGMVVQDTYTMAYETIWKAVCEASGIKNEEQEKKDMLYVPHIWIDGTNLDSEENSRILYD